MEKVANGAKSAFDQHVKDNVSVLQSRAVNLLLTRLRNKDTKCKEFNIYADRLMRLLAEEALARLPFVQEDTVNTPCGVAKGLVDSTSQKLCVVSIPRSGDILQEAVRKICPGVGIGKILLQRNEESVDKKPILYYKKLPKHIAECFVILVDPMLATAGSSKRAISVLLEAGVKENNIMFVNLICCPEGLYNMFEEYPSVKVVTCCVDNRLDENKFIVPGLGDYGDRYYETE